MKFLAQLRNIQLSLRSKLVLSFLVVVLIGTLISTIVGIRLVGDTVIEQAQNKVKHDLAAAWMVYNGKSEEIKSLVQLTSERFFLQEAFRTGELTQAKRELERVRKESGLDSLTLTDRTGVVILRTRDPYNKGDDRSNDDLVSRALSGEVVASTEIVPEEQLTIEGDGLVEQAYMKFVPTPKAKQRIVDEETAGMMLKAAAPLTDISGNVIGVLYGGVLLNRNYELVDRIKDTVYRDERYKTKEIGTATIFQWDLRISTNVRKADGNRAIGTRVSETVYDRVLEDESAWTDRAFVVNDWYVTAYEPIRDIGGKVVGMLYVGMLEQPYVDMKQQVIWSIIKYSFLLSMAVALVIAFLLGSRITRPVGKLARASEQISRGHFSQEVVSKSRDEIGRLADSFNQMSMNLKRTLQEKDLANKQLQDLNLRYLELLGFATHELMQPLGVLKGYLTMMRDSETGSLARERQRQAISAMLRNIDSLINMSQMYLELSKIESGELEVNREKVKIYLDVIEPVVEDMQPQMALKNMRFKLDNEEILKRLELEVDPVLMRIVYGNLIGNAIKYGREGGEIRCGFEDAGDFYRFNVRNEGQGIPAEKLEAVFGRFVRLETDSRQRRGTGLGLFNTKEIIERHGGEIWAESVEGEWVDFIFKLPKKAPNQVQQSGTG